MSSVSTMELVPQPNMIDIQAQPHKPFAVEKTYFSELDQFFRFGCVQEQSQEDWTALIKLGLKFSP